MMPSNGNQMIKFMVDFSNAVSPLHILLWALMYHLSYYILAHRIRVLRLYLTEAIVSETVLAER